MQPADEATSIPDPSIELSVQAQAASKPNNRKRWVGIAQVVISVVILAWLLNKIGLRNILDTFGTLNVWLYFWAGIALLASIGARAFRWKVLLTPLGVDSSILNLFRLYLVGFFWNSFLPSGFGGDVVKAVELGQSTQNGAAAVVSVIFDRLMGLLSTCLMAPMIIPFWPRLFPPVITLAVVAISIPIVAGTWLLRLDVLDWIDRKLPVLKFISRNKHVISLHETLRLYSLKNLATALLAAVPFTVLTILNNYLVGLALGVRLSILTYALYTPIIAIVSLLPISFNGLGVRDSAYKVLFTMVDIPVPLSVTMALAQNLLRFAVEIIGGILSLIGGIQRAAATDPYTV